MWSAPLSALIIAYFLYIEAGYAGLIGIAAVFVVVPIQCEFLTPLLEIYATENINLKSCKILFIFSFFQHIRANYRPSFDYKLP